MIAHTTKMAASEISRRYLSKDTSLGGYTLHSLHRCREYQLFNVILNFININWKFV